MRQFPRRAAAALVAVLALAAIVALSRSPYELADGDRALLRLSWSGRPERIERCRRLSDEEIDKLPAHMRRRVECEGRAARYAVRVLRDGTTLSVDTVTGGGLRGDRAIHMLREYRLAPGVHAIGVEVARTDATRSDERAEDETGSETAARDDDRPDRVTRERDERRRQRQERLPARLRLDTTVRMMPGTVLLISYDPAGRRLVASTGVR